MITDTDTLRERLLDFEPARPEKLERLIKELDTMFDHRLTRNARIWWTLGLIAAIIFAIYGALVTCLAPLDVPLMFVWLIYTLANVAFIVFAVNLLRSGTLNLRRLLQFLNISPAGALLIAVLLFIRAAIEPTTESLLWAGFGMLCLGVAMAWSLHNRIRLAELSSREHFLRCEYQLLKLAERLGGDDDNPMSAVSRT